MAEGIKRQKRIKDEEDDMMAIIHQLKEEIKDKDKQIRELKLDLQAKDMEKSDYTKEQFWRLVVRHEQDIVNFDEEKTKFVSLWWWLFRWKER